MSVPRKAGIVAPELEYSRDVSLDIEERAAGIEASARLPCRNRLASCVRALKHGGRVPLKPPVKVREVRDVSAQSDAGSVPPSVPPT